MQRNDWTFEYPADVVMEAGRKRLEHHRERAGYWSGILDKAKQEIKDHGIEVHEQQGTMNRLDWAVDRVLERRYAEATEKLARHNAAAEQYEAWCRVLELNQGIVLTLDHDDIIFFGL